KGSRVGSCAGFLLGRVRPPQCGRTASRVAASALRETCLTGIVSVIIAYMDLDAKVCYCFHVTRRKLVNFLRLYHPRVPSQLSECGGAGTGCGWCIPFLKQLHQQA